MHISVSKKGSPNSFLHFRLAIFYLLIITGAEIVTNFYDLVIGLIFHIILLTVLIAHSSLATKPTARKLLLALTLCPLTRIMGLSMPLTQIAPIYWYMIIYPPLFLGAWIVMRRLNFTAREIGLNGRRLPLQLVIALSGIVFGISEYLILRPEEPLIPGLTWGGILLTLLALVAGTGFVEEFVFRGVLQRASMETLGRWGLPYAAALFAILHVIHHSALDLVFVFVVALLFGWIVNKTGSLLGVTLAHGITNTLLYSIIPLLV